MIRSEQPKEFRTGLGTAPRADVVLIAPGRRGGSYCWDRLFNGSRPPRSTDYQPSRFRARQKVNDAADRIPFPMVQGDEGPAAGEADVGAGGRPGEGGGQRRSLRDEMRRLP